MGVRSCDEMRGLGDAKVGRGRESVERIKYRQTDGLERAQHKASEREEQMREF